LPETKLKNSQLPTTIQDKTIDTSNDISTTTTKLKVSGGTNGQVLTTDGSGNLSWLTAQANIPDGDKGDITVGSSGTTWTIDNDAVTYAKIQNVSGASKLLGRGDSGSGDVQEITLGTGLTMTGTTISTDGGAGGDVPTFMVVKSADETVINSNTLQPDDEIVFAGTAGKRYYFECVVIYQRSNFGGGGDQPGIRITMGNELAIQGLMNTIPIHPNNTVWVFGGDSFPGRIDYSVSITQAIAIKMQGTYFPQTGQNAIMRLRWTQITPSATVGTMVLKGSKLLVWEL
jgi:hypothetical protein